MSSVTPLLDSFTSCPIPLRFSGPFHPLWSHNQVDSNLGFSLFLRVHVFLVPLRHLWLFVKEKVLVKLLAKLKRFLDGLRSFVLLAVDFSPSKKLQRVLLLWDPDELFADTVFFLLSK